METAQPTMLAKSTLIRDKFQGKFGIRWVGLQYGDVWFDGVDFPVQREKNILVLCNVDIDFMVKPLIIQEAHPFPVEFSR